MLDDLPRKPKHKESAVVNLDDSSGEGTHWVCYSKRGNQILYFDSFGDLPPPHQLIRYWGKNSQIKYNYDKYQNFNSYNCGHLCLKFLYKYQ